MEDDLPRQRGDAATKLSYESLERYSQDELMQRIELLEAEIARVKAQHSRAAEQRRLADSLFSPATAPGDGG